MASGDAYILPVIQGVHNFATGCSVPARNPDRWIVYQRMSDRLQADTFSDLPEDSDEETVRRHARAYIMMLLLTQLFSDKFGFRLEGFDTFHWPLALSSPDVMQVVHSEILEPRHTALWRVVTALIYFAIIE
ncbi:hypothetical protein Ahy_B03g066486 [Arachis hypogaea]|uniref:Aminotransferase-like plant mobile domain-containing protein n=1 Tax=Arachis hypogaea TaxID=3818 RepID=A0A445A468_ARAHY|nr:hypothetical protein Ahy_B03g066486 [Arachis hypogaea]